MLIALALGTLAGAVAGLGSVRVGALVLPADMDGGARLGIVTLVGCAAWAVVALVVTAVVLRRSRAR